MRAASDLRRGFTRLLTPLTAEPARPGLGTGRQTGRTIRFRVLLGLAFAMIVAASSGALLYLSETTLSTLRQGQVDQQFQAVASLARSSLAAQMGSADVVLDTLAMSVPYAAASEDTATSLARILSNLRETSPAVLAVVVSFGDGSFSLARKVTAAGAAKAKAAGAAREAAFELQTGMPAPEGRADSFTYLDKDYGVLARSGPFRTDYDTRQRPWYRLARASERAVITPPYRFQDYDYTGLTLSRQAAGSPATVFGIDITLADLSDVLARSTRFPDEDVVLFSDEGLLIAGSGTHDAVDLRGPGAAASPAALRLARALYAAFLADPASRTRTVAAGGREMLATFAPIGFGDQRFVLASALPLDVIRAPIERWARESLAVQLGVALAAVLVAVGASRWIAGPILALAGEVERIVAFRFGEGAPIGSRVWEVRRLAAAVNTLEVTLRAFSSYLPPAFVQGIVARRALPTLGGRKQKVVVMFSDIEGFTTIAEAAQPDRLMAQLSRYFAAIADAVAETGGTVDKYIGDSVMAFWPAEGESEAAAQACRAVLTAAGRIAALNAGFEAHGLPVFRTRFGLHQGEAMLGNVGAADRMNYTVLGHAVNVASRLEGLNKVYGTSVLVSHAVREAVTAGFAFHPVDTVSVRGAREEIVLYELRLEAD